MDLLKKFKLKEGHKELCILPMSSAGQEREKKANEWSSAPWK
jgi:hypothetical protein